jgi:hypothetical protein
MATASRSLATALWGARFASGLLCLSYTTPRDTTQSRPSAAIRSLPSHRGFLKRICDLLAAANIAAKRSRI